MPRQQVLVFATVQGGKSASEAIVDSAAQLGYESAQQRPPEFYQVDFVDFPFTDESATFDDHLAAVARDQPAVAVAPDIEAGRDPADVYDQADELAKHAEHVVVVPKAVHPSDVPDRFRVGVPLADFGSDAPWQLPEYADAGDLHLLGGSPSLQLEAGRYLPDVASIDGAAIFRGAEMGNIWAPDLSRDWHPTGPHQFDFYERARHSLDNIVRAWADLQGYESPVDGDLFIPDDAELHAEAHEEAVRDVEAAREEQVRNRGEDVDAMSEDELRYRRHRGRPIIPEETADLWGADDNVPGETWDWAEEMEQAHQENVEELRDDMEQAGLDQWATDDADQDVVTDGGRPIDDQDATTDEGLDAPTMYWVKGPQGPQDWLDDQDVLISAGAAWRNPGQGFSTDVPDADRLFVDSGGYQAAVHFQDEYPYSPRELLEWAEEIGADYLAGMDWACEDAEQLASLYDNVDAENIAPVQDRLEWSVRDQVRQKEVYDEGDWSFQLVPVVQGLDEDDYRWCARQLRLENLAETYMGIGTVCKRESADGILDVLDVCEEELPATEWHLFGATKEVWTDRRFWDRFRSADTHAWAMKTPEGEWTQNDEDKIRAFNAYQEDIEAEREKMANQSTFAASNASRAFASSLMAIGARQCVCGTCIPAYKTDFEPGCRHCEMTALNRWDAALADTEEASKKMSDDPYDPTDEYDEIEETSDISGIGEGRRKTLAAIEAKDTLDDPQSFSSLQEMKNAVREISLAHPDGRTFMAPPEDALERIDWAYNDLPDEAQPEFLNDHRLYVKIRAARNRFNDWMGKRRRRDKIPSTMEAGPSNYPSKKANETARYSREAKDELDEAIDKIGAAAKGARQRALEAIGSSVAEKNAQEAQEKADSMKERLAPGDVVSYRDTHYGQTLWGVKRLNKKSVRLKRPHQSAGMDKPMSDGTYPEFDHTTVDYDNDRLRPISREELDDFDQDGDFEIPVTEGYEATIRYLMGDDWVDDNLGDDLEPDDASVPDGDDGPAFDDEEREAIREAVQEGNFSGLIRTVHVDKPLATQDWDFAGIESAEDFVDHYDDRGDFEAVHGVGPATSEDIEEAVPIVREALEDTQSMEDTDESDTYDPSEEWTDDRAQQGTLGTEDPTQHRESRIDEGGSDEFVDDTGDVYDPIEEVGEQGSLVPEEAGDEGQVDLTGDRATEDPEWDDADDKSGEWTEALEYVRESYDDSFQARNEFANDLMSWGRENDVYVPKQVGWEGVGQPILRFQDIPPGDAYKQIEAEIGDDEMEELVDAMVQFANDGAARDDGQDTVDDPTPAKDQPWLDELNGIGSSTYEDLQALGLSNIGDLKDAYQDRANSDTWREAVNAAPSKEGRESLVEAVGADPDMSIAEDMALAEDDADDVDETVTITMMGGEPEDDVVEIDVPRQVDGWELDDDRRSHGIVWTPGGDGDLYVSVDRASTYSWDSKLKGDVLDEYETHREPEDAVDQAERWMEQYGPADDVDDDGLGDIYDPIEEWGPTMDRPISDVYDDLVHPRTRGLSDDAVVDPVRERRRADVEDPNELEHHEEMMGQVYDPTEDQGDQEGTQEADADEGDDQDDQPPTETEESDTDDSDASDGGRPWSYVEYPDEVEGGAGTWELVRSSPTHMKYERQMEGEAVELVNAEKRGSGRNAGSWTVTRYTKSKEHGTQNVSEVGTADGAEELKEMLLDEIGAVDEDDQDDEAGGPDPGRAEPLEFGTLDAANQFRDDNEDWLHPSDHRSYKTVKLSAEAPDEVLDEAGKEVQKSTQDETKKYGQTELSESEKNKLQRMYDDWTWGTHGFQAMSVKAALQQEGATDWMNYYEPGMDQDGAVSLLESGKEAAAAGRGKTATRGDRFDTDPDPGDIGTQIDKAEDEACDQAADYAEHEGDETAAEFLVSQCGWSESEVEQLLEVAERMGEDPQEIYDPTAETDNGLTFEEWARQNAPQPPSDDVPDMPAVLEEPSDEELAQIAPTPTPDEMTGPALRALKKAWAGYKAARAESRQQFDDAEEYASVINGIRAVNDQEPIDFDSLEWEGGDVMPDDPSETYPAPEGTNETMAEAAEHGHASTAAQSMLGRFTDAAGSDPYDPTEDL